LPPFIADAAAVFAAAAAMPLVTPRRYAAFFSLLPVDDDFAAITLLI